MRGCVLQRHGAKDERTDVTSDLHEADEGIEGPLAFILGVVLHDGVLETRHNGRQENLNTEGWIGRSIDRYVGRQIGREVDGWMDEWVDRQMDGQNIKDVAQQATVQRCELSDGRLLWEQASPPHPRRSPSSSWPERSASWRSCPTYSSGWIAEDRRDVLTCCRGDRPGVPQVSASYTPC